MSQRTYICIDLKSFYASVECKERGLDPLKANLVVADPQRSDRTVCLAIPCDYLVMNSVNNLKKTLARLQEGGAGYMKSRQALII